VRLTHGENAFGASLFSWTGHRVCFLDEKEIVKTIDLEDSGPECPEIDCAAFCSERGLLVIGDNYRTLRYCPLGRELTVGSLTRRMMLRYGLRTLTRILMLNLKKDMIVHYSILTYKQSMAKVFSSGNIAKEAYIISAWRDHTVLVHSGRETWQLKHALTHHRLGVNYARFFDQKRFITSSLDRTVAIHEIDDSQGTTVIQTVRTINLARTHAVDIEITAESLIISTSDRQILTYDMSSGDLLHAYKSADSSELVTLGNIGLSKSLNFPPLTKTKTLGSPAPQGQIRSRTLLAGAGNDKVHYLCSKLI